MKDMKEQVKEVFAALKKEHKLWEEWTQCRAPYPRWVAYYRNVRTLHAALPEPQRDQCTHAWSAWLNQGGNGEE